MRKSILKRIIALGVSVVSVLAMSTISYANEDSFSVVGNPNLFGEINPDSTNIGWTPTREEQLMTKVEEMEGVYKYTGNYVEGCGEFDEFYKLNWPEGYEEELKKRTQFKILGNALEEGWRKQMCMGYLFEEWEDNQTQFLIEEIEVGEYDIYIKPSKGFVCVIQDGEILPLKLRYKSKDEDCTEFVEPTEEGIAEYIAHSKETMGYECKLNDEEYELFKKECLEYVNGDGENKDNKIVWVVEPNIVCDDIVPIKDIFPKFAQEKVREDAGDIGNTVFFYINEKAGMMDYNGNVKLDTSMDMYIDLGYEGIMSRKTHYAYNSEGENLYAGGGGGIWYLIWNESDMSMYNVETSVEKIEGPSFREENFMQGTWSVDEIIYSDNYEGNFEFNGRYRLTNQEHQLVIDEQFEDIKTDHSARKYIIGDYAVVKKNGLWGYIKQDGTKLLDYTYEDAYPFFDGIAAVKKDCRAGFINEEGTVVIDFMFEETRSINDGLAWVKYNGKWGVIDVEKTMSNDGNNNEEEITNNDESISNEETKEAIENNTVEETKSNTETTKISDENPQTGDENVGIVMLLIMLIAGTVIVKTTLSTRKE